MPGRFISPSTRWELWRQDDNGNRVMIRAFADRTEAEAELARFDSLQHKQTYWLHDRLLSGSDGPAG